VQKPTQALKSVKGPRNIFEWNPKRARTLPSLIYFSWNIYRSPLHNFFFQISKLIFDTLLWAWGAETHQALKSVKGPGNTFDLNPKWSSTLPFLIYFSLDIYRDPLLHKKKIKYQSWYLTPCCGLEVQKPTQVLQSVKGQRNTFDWNPKWARTFPSLIYFLWDIYRDPPP
jgi:hypothetical protein